MERFNIAVCVLCLSLFLTCSGRPSSENTQGSAKERATAPPTVAGLIRSIDFKRISYPRYRDVEGKHITTKPGQAWPAFVEYGDVTADGKEDAIVVLAEQTRGTAVPYHVYVFSILDSKPTLLADIETCDRADGGLRRAFAEGGNLVVELYGRGKILGTNLCADDGTRSEQPYPFAITRSRYVWKTGRFIQHGAAEEFSDASHYGSPIMTPYP